jgi:hypothetical protein
MRQPYLVKKFKRNVNDYGSLAAAGKVFRYLLSPFFEHITYRVYAIDLTDLAVPRVERDDVVFRVVGQEDTGIIEQITCMEEWLEGQLKTKLLRNGLCIAAMEGHKVAGFNLISFSTVYLPLMKLHKSLNSYEAWSEQITVAKNFRKKKLATDIRYFTLQQLQKRGIAQLYGATQISNTASLHLAQKVGFRYIEDIHYFNLLGYKTWKYRKIK